MSVGPLRALSGASGNSVRTPAGVMRPRALLLNSVNHRLPSAPWTMPVGWEPAVRPVNSVTTAGTQRSSSSWSMGRNVGLRDARVEQKRLKNRPARRHHEFMAESSRETAWLELTDLQRGRGIDRDGEAHRPGEPRPSGADLSNEDAAGEGRGGGEEAVQNGQVHGAEDLDMRPAALPARGVGPQMSKP